jgi:carotenoid 1,2-hydratase
VFSPYYAGARRRGEADPTNHVSINAILYTPRGKYWAMTERARPALDRSANHLAIGPSAWSWQDRRITIDINEWAAPLPRRMRGRVTIDPGPVFERTWRLDGHGHHLWRPIAPCATVSVAFDKPGLDWTGRAYVDTNRGEEPLETCFSRWNWSREDRGTSTRILYDVATASGGEHSLALEYRADGTCGPFEPGAREPLRRTGWRVPRETWSTPDRPVRVLRALEDTPFYSRSLLGFGRVGEETRSIHESVDFSRFRAGWVQALLPFRMPRKAW